MILKAIEKGIALKKYHRLAWMAPFAFSEILLSDNTMQPALPSKHWQAWFPNEGLLVESDFPATIINACWQRLSSRGIGLRNFQIDETLDHEKKLNQGIAQNKNSLVQKFQIEWSSDSAVDLHGADLKVIYQSNASLHYQKIRKWLLSSRIILKSVFARATLICFVLD